MAYTEEALRSLVGDYDEGKRQLLDRRDQRIRDFHAAGWRPVDLHRLTGYSRGTIRHALQPDVRRALVELWPTLWLPPRLREMWEARFPELAARRPEVA